MVIRKQNWTIKESQTNITDTDHIEITFSFEF